jgi:restriction system protein
LARKPDRIDIAFLRQYPEFVEFQTPKPKKDDDETSEADEGATPEEEIEEVYQRLREGLAEELLETVKGCSPTFFEHLVLDLLVKMGYGGTRKDAGEAIGRSGDGGVDGIIKEDRLGLDIVYIQAKKWETTVSRPEIQKFAGALQGQRARKGVFLTTSGFSKAAREYVSRIDSKIVLIDGDTLSQLMIDFDIGVSGVATYELKRVDIDYFTEE